MGKRWGVDIRRDRRDGGHPRRIRHSNHPKLRGLPSDDGSAVRRRERAVQKASARAAHDSANWRVIRYQDSGEVVAIEPNRDYEHTFDGYDDDLMSAIEFAAQRLRGEVANAN